MLRGDPQRLPVGDDADRTVFVGAVERRRAQPVEHGARRVAVTVAGIDLHHCYLRRDRPQEVLPGHTIGPV